MAVLRVHFKHHDLSSVHSMVCHLDRLREMECAYRFIAALSNQFTAFKNLTNTVAPWDSFKYKMLYAAQDSIDKRLRTRQSHLTVDARSHRCM